MGNEISNSRRQLSATGPSIFPLALGRLGMSGMYGPAPVIGARTRAQLTESLGALRVRLSAAELTRVEEAITPASVAGTRYDEHQMRMLDSER